VVETKDASYIMKINQCPVCGSTQLNPVLQGNRQPLARYGLCQTEWEALNASTFSLQIVQCASCGVLFNQDFDFSKIDYGSEGVQESRVFSPRIRAHMVESAKRLGALLNLKGDVVLEIGCGEGFFLDQLSTGNECIAYEPSPEGLEAERRGIQVRHEYFDPAKEHDFSPKLAIMRQVLEHLENPQDYLHSLRALLTRGSQAGYLYIEVPNSNKTIDESRFHDFYYEHFSYYTSGSISHLLERSGFRVISCREAFDGEILEVIAKPTVNGDFMVSKALEDMRARFKRIVDERINAGKKVVAWGTAGNGCSFMNLCGFTKDKIPLIVDSDERKQGRFLPGTGQLVVSPESLRLTHPDVILILSQFHKADISEQIAAMFQEAPEIISVGL
jgi:hypothetical protein